jgi:hypothetical protein
MRRRTVKTLALAAQQHPDGVVTAARVPVGQDGLVPAM